MTTCALDARNIITSYEWHTYPSPKEMYQIPNRG